MLGAKRSMSTATDMNSPASAYLKAGRAMRSRQGAGAELVTHERLPAF
jgi:hypothetical protein